MKKKVILSIRNLTKKYYKNSNNVLENLNLTVYEGEIFGFLGRNGIGKSTTIKCITGLISFDSGEIIINDFDVQKDSLKAKQQFGFVPDNHLAYETMTGREYIDFIASIYGKVDDYQEYFDYLVDYFELRKAIDQLINSYSHGMLQKICLIASLIHRPKLWILDEPFTGLDIMVTKKLIAKMREYRDLGNTVFITSHNIDLVEKLCDRVGIINNGMVVKVVEMADYSDLTKVEELFYQLTGETK